MYMSLSSKHDVSCQGGLENLNFTEILFKLEVLFQIVSYFGAGVSLMLRSNPGVADKSKYHKSLYMDAGSAAG